MLISLLIHLHFIWSSHVFTLEVQSPLYRNFSNQLAVCFILKIIFSKISKYQKRVDRTSSDWFITIKATNISQFGFEFHLNLSNNDCACVLPCNILQSRVQQIRLLSITHPLPITSWLRVILVVLTVKQWHEQTEHKTSEQCSRSGIFAPCI